MAVLLTLNKISYSFILKKATKSCLSKAGVSNWIHGGPVGFRDDL